MSDASPPEELPWWVTPVLSAIPVLAFGALFGILLGGGAAGAVQYAVFIGATWMALAVATAWIKRNRGTG